MPMARGAWPPQGRNVTNAAHRTSGFSLKGTPSANQGIHGVRAYAYCSESGCFFGRAGDPLSQSL